MSNDKMTSKEFQQKLLSGELGVGAKGSIISQAITSQVPQSNFQISDNKKVIGAKKRDINLEVIPTSIPIWRKEHPDEIYFDSLIEGQFYHFLKENGIEFNMKEKIEIIPKFSYIGRKQQARSWKPDYVIRTDHGTIIIDTKGYPDASFALKLAMVMYFFSKQLFDQPHIWFVSSKKKFPIVLNCIRRVQKNKGLDGIETSLIFTPNKPKKKKK